MAPTQGSLQKRWPHCVFTPWHKHEDYEEIQRPRAHRESTKILISLFASNPLPICVDQGKRYLNGRRGCLEVPPWWCQYKAQGLTMWPWLHWTSLLCLSSAGVKGVSHHTPSMVLLRGQMQVKCDRIKTHLPAAEISLRKITQSEPFFSVLRFQKAKYTDDTSPCKKEN